MPFVLWLKPKAEKALNKLSPEYRHKMICVFKEMCLDPFLGKKLSGDKKGQYSVRVWPYRVIYSIQKGTLVVVIIDIGHRQGIYKR